MNHHIHLTDTNRTKNDNTEYVLKDFAVIYW